MGRDIAAASLYVANIAFARQSLDYLAADISLSPVLHFWSLAVEEQFYLLWPLTLLCLASALGKRMAIGLAVMAVGSFLFCLYLSVSSQPWAFFGTPARAWQFAVGGLVYLGAPHLSRPVVGWTGLLMIVASCLVITDATPYPGWAALAPTLGAALVIAGRSVFLAGRWFRAVGRISYSWYLWHWPFIVFGGFFGVSSWQARLVLTLVASLPAYASYRLVEGPLRRPGRLVPASNRAAWLVAAAASVSVAIASTVLLPTSAGKQDIASDQEGSRQGAEGGIERGVLVSPADSRQDLPSIYANGCHLGFTETSAPSCRYGNPDGPKHVLLWGDSHAAQWFPALELVALQQGWQLTVRTKSSCPASSVGVWNSEYRREYTECSTFRAQVMALIESERPDLVIMSESRGAYHLIGKGDGKESEGALWRKGFDDVVGVARESGAVPVFIRDAPRMPSDPNICLAEGGVAVNKCGAMRDAAVSAGYTTGAVTVDLTDAFCDQRLCAPIRANMLVYRDDHHMTATFSRALGPMVGQQLISLGRPRTARE